MDAQDLLPHRTALIGAAVALAIGVTGGLILKTGSQAAPEAETYAATGSQYAEVEPIAWPTTGKIADYVIGTDFTRPRPPEQPPVVVASYEVPEYVPASLPEPEAAPALQPVRTVQAENRPWPSTQGDILDTRLPDEAPSAPEAPVPPAAPTAPVALAAAY